MTILGYIIFMIFSNQVFSILYQKFNPSGVAISPQNMDIHGLHPRLLKSWTTSWSSI